MIKPMLAATATLQDVEEALKHGPLLILPKIDGIRCLIKGGKPYMRSMKPLPNGYVSEILSDMDLEGLDGELVVGKPTDPNVFQNTTGFIRRDYQVGDFTYLIFDNYVEDGGYDNRHSTLVAQPYLSVVHTYKVNTLDEFKYWEAVYLKDGYEGVILRDPNGRYKFGRSTLKERGMLKVKRMQDSEAEVIGVVELMHNANIAQTNELGRTFRTSHKDGLVGTGTMGALLVRDLTTGIEFSIGTGFNDAQRKLFMKNPPKIVCYKSMPYGVKDKPRHPSFKGERIKEDMY
jgi:DNA ligase-1